jgi:IclR helix-turn-helix domain./Nucleotidyltransferase domain.
MLRTMNSILTEPAAAALLVLDEAESATLTEIARATGKPISTIQRAVNGLVDASVVVRETPRGRLRFTTKAPRHALRELAEWRLGRTTANRIVRDARVALPASWSSAPRTIRDERIRAAWPQAIRSIVSVYQPARVILFGSQARGDAVPDSDVDLLVLFDDDRDRRERRIGIRRLLRDMPFAKDVLVASVADLEHSVGGTAVAGAIRDGVVVYER